ncbi:unnamed protein product [Parnassius mnemosyne]|uniref:Reverse transcriptase domain-containing protein n=1 Tax=Parnassius mnemosyne TaxID=213953 RepID=A0AAV1L6Q3_9NEOP
MKLILQILSRILTYFIFPTFGALYSTHGQGTQEHTQRIPTNFVSEIKDLHLADNETMVSFDVQSLFTRLPVEDCILIFTRRLEENYMPVEYAVLLRHCLTSGYLLWKEEFYKKVDGVAMGSPVSPIVADIFMID